MLVFTVRTKSNILCFARFLQAAGVIVFLNKQDMLKEKVESGKSIAPYFPEYKKYRMSSTGEYS
jgi:guanine nucleotide-binding protein subunit alpha